MGDFKEISIKDLTATFSSLIGENYALITVGDKNNMNMMTASWGTMGIMWNKNVVNMVVRPSRYTYEYMVNNECFTLNFLEEGNQEIYSFCGTKSGRDYDKVKETGLIPIEVSDSCFAFDKSKYVFVCKKLYSQPMDLNCFNSTKVGNQLYPNNDIHVQFIAEIEKIYIKNC